jgi:hypothetical protein
MMSVRAWLGGGAGVDIDQKFGQLKLSVDKYFIFAQCTVTNLLNK